MPPNSTSARGSAFVLVAIVVCSGLAAGALSCLASLVLGRDTLLLMLPLALAIGWLLRWQGYRGARGAVGAAIATLVSLAYAEYLFAAVRIADMLGFPLRDTLFKLDWGLARQIVLANFDAWHGATFLLAPLLAAMVATAALRDPRS